MKIYYYNEPDGEASNVVVRMTREDILVEYWDYWLEKMTQKYGEGHELITEENCIEDWVVTHWAWIEEYDFEDLVIDGVLTEEEMELLRNDEQSGTEKQTTE